MKPKAIIFDFFGVICTNVAGRWFKEYLPRSDADFVHETMFRADLGHESENETFAKLAQASGVSHDVRERWLKDAVIDKELVEMIRKLKGSYKTAVCTNAPAEFFREVARENNLEDAFDVIVVSSEVGMVKPENDIFHLVCERLGIAPEEAVFIDDTERNVRAAEALGMQGVVFSSRSQLERFL